MKELFLGNQAIARGAWEAGVRVVSSYPGTPSTEITEFAATYPEIYAEWAPNEKVALEVGFGASLGGARAMVCMKHVGLNVAADPLFTASYTGVNGGLVIVVADDPGMHSSQNEQDSRYYARSAHLPMLEPSDSAECAEFVRRAFEISEEYDTPVLLRVTTRVAHSRSLVELNDRQEQPLKDYKKDISKYVMMPAMARGRHVVVENREKKLAGDVNSMGLHSVRMADTKVGIVTAGIAACYVDEALPEASVLKLGMINPLPMKAIVEFANRVEKLYVVEELEPVIEEQLKAAGLSVKGKELFSVQGEYTAQEIARVIGGKKPADHPDAPVVPGRPPVLCPGCPHRGVFYTLKSMGLTVTGDIGCYTLGAAAPLSSIDACLCMGASIGMAQGMELARGRDHSKKTVAVIGDSTFIHSGMTGLAEMSYNGGHGTVMILDNSTTGMTGHQNNPANGKNIHGDPAPKIDLDTLCRALGVQDVKTVDPFDLKALRAAVKDSLEFDGVSVIIARRPCALLSKAPTKAITLDQDKCRKCRACMKIACPALVDKGDHIEVDATLCNGCGLCAGLCAFDALKKGE